jgi:protein-tyrosine phosphatase
METILQGQPNFRDLGGMTNRSGLKVKENTLYRSGFIGEMDANDLSVLEQLNISKVLDLRTIEEIDLLGCGTYPASIKYENIPLNAGNISKSLIPIFEKGNFHLLEPDTMSKIYFDLITKFNDELASIMRTIINTDEGIVYHCSHGKDRTGIISAFLLDFLEVDRETIFADYLASNELLKRKNEFQIQMIKDNFSKHFKKDVSEEEFAVVRTLFYCQKETMQDVFSYIDKEYGSIKTYFKTELGLTEEELALLKSKYLA